MTRKRLPHHMPQQPLLVVVLPLLVLWCSVLAGAATGPSSNKTGELVYNSGSDDGTHVLSTYVNTNTYCSSGTTSPPGVATLQSECCGGADTAAVFADNLQLFLVGDPCGFDGIGSGMLLTPRETNNADLGYTLAGQLDLNSSDTTGFTLPSDVSGIGSSLALVLSDDGWVAVLSGPQAQAAYVWTAPDTGSSSDLVWTFTALLEPNNTAYVEPAAGGGSGSGGGLPPPPPPGRRRLAGDTSRFGGAVQLVGCCTLAVSATESRSSTTESGSVYLFEADTIANGTWSQSVQVVNPALAGSDVPESDEMGFGTAIALSDSFLVVGNPAFKGLDLQGKV